ncbi:MAG: hypothetical protein ACKO2L_16160 [Planctomycetaceae bacterium]
MIPESLRQQIDQWFDGELSEADEFLLRASLERFPESLDYFCDRGLLHQMLAESSAACAPPELSTESRSRAMRLLSPSRWSRRALLTAASAVAACVLLCCLLFLPAAAASPAELVRRTLAEFQSAADRCYAVAVESEGPLRRTGFRRRVRLQDSSLWVRGNSFVQSFEAEDGQLVWGRNAEGAVWFSVAGESAAIFDADEIPEVLMDACELRTLQLPALLETLLLDYELQYSSQQPDTSRIVARPRSVTVSSKYGNVEIEIDPRSLLVRQVTLERLRDQRLVAVVSFSLTEVRSRKESLYELSGNLQPTATVLDRNTKVGGRSELLRRFLQKLRVHQPEPSAE